MPSSDDILVQHLKGVIEVYKQRYETNECHIFFSKDDTSESFCDQSIDMLKSFLSLNIENVRESARHLANAGIQSDTPYLIVINIITSFKHDLMNLLLQDRSSEMAHKSYALCNAAENSVSQAYLNFEIDTFIQFNKIRMDSIKRLSNINALGLYEAHLIWFDSLVVSLKDMDMSKLPELNPGKCVVGKWLTMDASKIITDKMVLDRFTSLHNNLHLIAKHIELTFETKPIDFNILMLLLKKAELFSLSLGVELSIINNIHYQATASKDPLTGALNRQLLFHIFSTQFELSRAIEKSFSLVMIDLDDFKSINDDYGHTEGDKVLKSFTAMITQNLRDSDFIIRYGGEEFLLILPSTSLDNAVKLAENLKDTAHTLKVKDNLEKGVSGSFGVIQISPEPHETMSETLMLKYIQQADKELYFAKEHGKDQVSSPNRHEH